ncbi:MAG: hypothetical protein WCC63_02570 [Candidatus Bathyarchaeia archaeon]
MVGLITRQIEIEKEHAKHLRDVSKRVTIAAARLLLLEMRLDSEKHAAILTEMLEVIGGVPVEKSLWNLRLEEYVDEALVKREFEDHVKKEIVALKQLKEEVKHRNDESLKLLFENIEEDEQKHHKIIQSIVRNLYRID